MNFDETLTQLYHDTENISVYAGQAYDWINGDTTVPAIGIRSCFAGYKDNDPVVDETRFMICGTVFFSNGKEVTDIRDLDDMWTPDHDYFVYLRAVSSGFPSARIDLGKYEIVQKSCVDKNGNVTMDLVRMR